MVLADLAATSVNVAATSSRTEKLQHLAAALRRAAPDEVAVVTAYLSGDLRQRRTGAGWRSLQGLPAPAVQPSLTVLEVDTAFAVLADLSGPGSSGRRAQLLAELWSGATTDEQRFLAGLVSGELRQGASAGLVTDAVAKAADVPVAAVRRALTVCGSLSEVAVAALTGQPLTSFALQVGRGLSPMLAATAKDLDDAWSRVGRPTVIDWKLDGIRVQVHRHADDVRVFTRTLDDITARVPEIVAAALTLPARSLVLDGEALSLDMTGRPRPFQETASRAASRSGTHLTPWFFDVLHAEGQDLLDAPLSRRSEVLSDLVPESQRAPRLITADVEEARAFADLALNEGHEGIVVKAIEAPYEAGRRGGSWLKVKPRHTLDLVVLAAEWGHGRRRGWLSNLHLGAREPDGGFVMLGKTFKGLTDSLLTWQTARLQELAISDDGWGVHVRPELVVEIAFDGVQTSPRYPGGVALRFARVLRYREDKTAAEADTIADVLRLRPG